MSKQTTKYSFMLFAILLTINLFVTGCEISRESGGVQIRLNPNIANDIETGGEDVLNLLTLFSVTYNNLFPFFSRGFYHIET